MTETELRSEVAKVRKLTAEGWKLLVDLGFVDEAVEEIGEAESDPVGYLVAHLDRFYAAAPSWAGGGRPKGRARGEEMVPPQLTDYEIERSELFSEYLARQAAPDGYVRQSTDGPIPVHPEIKDFRVKCLGDKLLTPQQAWALLTSPVAAYWRRFVSQELRVPVVGHTYEVTVGMKDKRGPYSLVEVPLPSSKVEAIKDRRPLTAGVWEIPEKLEDARSNEKPRREIKTGYPPQQETWKIVPYPGEDGYTHRVLAKPGTVLGDLYDKVSRLIQRYPWEEPDAVWFVLTGETPWVAPLTWQFRATGPGHDLWSYGCITLKVEPWVSASVVERVYSDLQHRLLGKDNKRVGEKNRELFRFVIGRMRPDGSLPKARELVKEWDHEYPQWRYRYDDTQQVRRFRRDFNLARRLLAAPSYELREE